MLGFPLITDRILLNILWVKTVGGWIAIFGNIVILCAILLSKNKKMKAISPYLICAQAVPDLLLGMLVGFTGVATIRGSKFPGEASCQIIDKDKTLWYGGVCTMFGFFVHSFCFASIYTLVLITWERYKSVTQPLKPKVSARVLAKLYLFVWLASFIFASIPFFGKGYVLQKSGGECYGYGGPGVVTTIVVFSELVATNYLIVAYTKMFFVIRKSFQCANAGRKTKGLTAEQKIAKQFFMIVACFMQCWFVALLGWMSAMIGYNDDPHVKWLEILGFMLGTLHSALGPFLIISINKHIRLAVIDLLGISTLTTSTGNVFSSAPPSEAASNTPKHAFQNNCMRKHTILLSTPNRHQSPTQEVRQHFFPQ